MVWRRRLRDQFDEVDVQGFEHRHDVAIGFGIGSKVPGARRTKANLSGLDIRRGIGLDRVRRWNYDLRFDSSTVIRFNTHRQPSISIFQGSIAPSPRFQKYRHYAAINRMNMSSLEGPSFTRVIPDGSESEHRDTPRVYESMLQENWCLKRTWIQTILRNEPCCTISRPCVGCMNQCWGRLSENRFLFQSWTSPCERHFLDSSPTSIRQWAIITIERGRDGVNGFIPEMWVKVLRYEHIIYIWMVPYQMNRALFNWW